MGTPPTTPRKPKRIRVIALAVLRDRKGRILVFDAFDEIKGSPFYRPLGGGVEPGEAAVDAVVRELREEIGAELLEPELLRVEENLFTMDGDPHHEVVFYFTGVLADPSLYEKEKIMVHEDNGQVLTARWRSLDFFDEHHRLVPEVLVEMLAEEVQHG